MYLKEVQEVCQGSFNGIKKKFTGSFKSVLNRGYFKIVLREFQGRLRDILREVVMGF